MSRLIDLTNQKFGRLTVLSRHGTTNPVLWECQCDCGNKHIVNGEYLRNGDSRSCGCYHAEKLISGKMIDKVGLVFGRLTVLSLHSVKPVKWLCRCECGNEKVIWSGGLRPGGTQSCGCLQKERAREAIPPKLSREEVSRRRKKRYYADIEATRKDRREKRLKILESPKAEEFKARHKFQCRKYRANNKEKISEASKIYNKNNIDSVRAYKNGYQKMKYRTDPKHRLNHIMSTSIRTSLKRGKEGRSWKELVPYSIDELKIHLESLFTEGMTWDNHGEWHVDHKIPQSVFNFTRADHVDFKRCWALKNLQPLWAVDNIMKQDKLEKPFQPMLKLNI